MSNPPERIWIEDEFGEGDDDQWTYGTWDVRNYAKYDVEYIRADTVQAQIDADLATRIAVEMEVHAALGTTTKAKANAVLALIRKGPGHEN